VAGTFLIVAVAKVGAWRDDVALWTASLVSDPGNALAHINLGAALARAGDLEGAEAAAREAVGRFPEDPRPAYLAGWLAELRDAPGEALRQYERSIALGIREGPAFRQAALLSARLKERDRAGRWFAAGADLFPRAAWPEVGLGWYLARTGRADLAQGHLDRAAQLEPNSPERPWFLGQLLAAEGDIQEADRAYRTALALDPSFVPARRELALMAEREGRRADAIADWRRIADALPGSHRVEAEEHLRRLQAAAPASAPRGAR
jgi:tetratricopeptide (TPR) repeat protein